MVGCEYNYDKVMYDKYIDVKEFTSAHGSNASIHYLSNGQPDIVRLLYDDAGQQTLPIEKDGITVPPSVLSGRYFSSDLDHVGGDKASKANREIEALIATTNSSYYEYIDILISTSLADVLGVSLDDPLVMKLSFRDPNGEWRTKYYMCKARAILNKISGLIMLPYDLTFASFLAKYQNAIISMDSFYKITSDVFGISLEEAEKEKTTFQKMVVDMPSGAGTNEFITIKQGLRNYVPNEEIQVLDMHELRITTQNSVSLVNVFFLILGSIGLLLSFFILWLSFLSNIRSSSWELGVLRSIGLSKVESAMIYIYEALALVFSCIFLGTAIGLMTAFMIIAQFNLFLMMPIELGFPYALYFTIVVLAIIVALLGSYMPMRKYMKGCVADVLRGG